MPRRASAIEPFVSDFRGLYHGSTPLVALPSTTPKCRAVLAICNELGVGVVPHGGNTSYCGGATPHAAGARSSLGLRRMNRIRALDAANFSMVVEAGCVLAEVQARRERGRPFVSAGARLARAAARSAATSRPMPAVSRRVQLRRHARPRARSRSRAGRRPRARRAEEPAQGQHGLRPAGPVHRRRGHARHHHGSEPEAVAASAHDRNAFFAVPDAAAAVRDAGATARSDRRLRHDVRVPAPHRRRDRRGTFPA